MRCLYVAALLVLVDIESEERTHLERTLGERDVHHITWRFDGGDPRELGVERMNALLLDTSGVHRRRPEIAALLRVASRRGLRRRRLLVDLAQVYVQLLADFITDSPRRFGRRNRMPLEPATICVLEKVDT